MTDRFAKAVAFMQDAHRSIDQRRKDNVRLYEVHPLDVVARLQDAGVTDEDVLIAGLFHDIVEDVYPKNPFYSLALIQDLFGPVVAGYVEELTDRYTKENYPGLNRKTRKQLERERYATFSGGAKQVKLADIASNLSDDGDCLLEDGSHEVGFQRMFIKEKALCLPYLDPKQYAVFDATASLYVRALDTLDCQKKKFDVR